MNFTLGVDYHSPTGKVFEPTYPFDDAAWAALWSDLGVTSQHIEEVTSVEQTRRETIPVVPAFPQLSRLLYVDEGVIRFRGSSVEELRLECIRLKETVAGKKSETLIKSLHETAIEANRRQGEVVIHPFGWRTSKG